jgi:hypothetical protein
LRLLLLWANNAIVNIVHNIVGLDHCPSALFSYLMHHANESAAASGLNSPDVNATKRNDGGP